MTVPEPFTLREYPGFLPGLALSILLAVLLYRYLSRWLGISRPVTLLLMLSIGVIIAATLTPGFEASPPALRTASCDTARFGPAPLRDYAALGTSGLNVLLFVPLGALIGQLPRTRWKAIAVLGAGLLPLTIESIQLVATPLARVCQVADVVDNMLGLTLGLAGGWTLAWTRRRVAKQPRRPSTISS